MEILGAVQEVMNNSEMRSNLVKAMHQFMEDRSKLIEIYPGNSITDNYVRWSKIANVEYINLKGDITNFKSDDKFRDANVKLNQDTINKIKLICI